MRHRLLAVLLLCAASFVAASGVFAGPAAAPTVLFAAVEVPPPPPIEELPTPVLSPPSNPRWGRWRPEDPHTVNLLAVYTRVDGAHLGVTYDFHRTDRALPRLSGEVGYAFARERLLYDFGASQPFLRERWIVGARAYRLTGSFEFDDEIVGTLENTMAALLVKQDYREYFEESGGEVFTTLNATDKYALTASWRAEEERPLAVAADWSMFGEGRFRPNPDAGRGTLRAVTVVVSHDSRPKDSDYGVPFIGEIRRSNRDWVRLTWETAGRDLGGDFDYAFARLDARGYWKLTPEQFFSARILTGREVRGPLPVQKEFYAGGISTLRAHPYKAYRGNRQFLFNAEYAVDLFRAAQGLLFTDVGRAWYAADFPNGPRLPVDVGVGVQTRDERLRIQFARDTRDSGAPIFVTVRTRATF